MKKYYYPIVLTLLGTLCFADSNSLSDREIQSLYDGAKEMEMLNNSMERGIQLHHQEQEAKVMGQPKVIQESVVEANTTIPGFQEESDRFYYEESVPNSKNTTVNIDVDGYNIIITTKTTHKEEKKKLNGMNIVESSSSNTTTLTLPYNADINRVKKSYKDGVIKITVPKKKEFLQR